MIALLPQYRGDVCRVRSAPLASAPDYVRSRNATRWHRPRSGEVYEDGRTAYSYWCGAGTPAGMGQDAIPTRDLLCATCEGRWKAQGKGRLIFTPRNSLPPKTCPASRSILFPSSVRRAFQCLVCGESVKVTARWNTGPRVSVHQVGPSLIDPCPHHGWNRLCLGRNEHVVCGCALRPEGW